MPRLLNLFPTPVYIGSIDVGPESRQQVIDSHYITIPGDNGHYTSNKHLLDGPGFEQLAQQIDIIVQDYAKNIYHCVDSIKFIRTTSWAVRHRPGDWAQNHRHLNSIITGIVYIQVNNESGNLIFNKNVNNLQNNVLELTPQGYNDYNSEFYSIVPQVNQIVIFPSNLEHRVSVNQSRQMRYCLAFNYFVRGQLGRDDSVLVLG